MNLDALLDRTVVFSYDRTGYARHARRFGDVVERDLDGADVLVTGGTSGVGLAAARALAARGARVHLWGRDAAKGERAVALVEAEGGRATFRSVDLADLDAVAAAAATLRTERLAALIAAAGGMHRDRELSPQGHERTWATQVLGHLLLLRLLRADQRLGRGSRVILVSSGGMHLARLDVTDVRCDGGYQRHRVHAHAKRAQVVLAAHLAERWPDVAVAAMHPGWVDTPGLRAGMPLFRTLTRPILRDGDEGADTAVWLAARWEAVPSGRFWFDRAPQPFYTRPSTRETREARNRFLREILSATDPWVPMPAGEVQRSR